MGADGRNRTMRVLLGITVAVAVGVAAYGAYLLVVGIPWMVVPEVPLGEALSDGSVVYRATPSGVIPLLSGIAVVIGLISRRLWIAWAGVVVVAGFSAAFLFGVGGILIVPAALLLVALAMLTLAYNRSKRSTGRTKTVAPPTSTSTG